MDISGEWMLIRSNGEIYNASLIATTLSVIGCKLLKDEIVTLQGVFTQPPFKPIISRYQCTVNYDSKKFGKYMATHISGIIKLGA